jgi:CheY-like chemotaxis protein
MSKLAFENVKVLIVDDHLLARKQMLHVLETVGFKSIDQAADVQEATQKIAACQFDVVLGSWYGWNEKSR